MRRLVQCLVLCVLGTLPVAGMADDWRQFRHDERRTGVSADRLPPPLTDIWTWEPGALKSSRPFGAPSVWQGRLYTFSHENAAPTLVCTDARTNTRIWQRPLGTGFESTYVRKDVGPAIGPDGTVYTYGKTPYVVPDEEVVRLAQSGLNADGVPRMASPRQGGDLQSQFNGDSFSRSYSLVSLRAYRGLDGLPMAQHPLPVGYPLREQNDYLFRTFLWDEPGVSFALPPGSLSHLRLAGTEGLGPPLILGGTLMAASNGDLLLEWTPGTRYATRV